MRPSHNCLSGSGGNLKWDRQPDDIQCDFESILERAEVILQVHDCLCRFVIEPICIAIRISATTAIYFPCIDEISNLFSVFRSHEIWENLA